jgi:hypothetical protein
MSCKIELVEKSVTDENRGAECDIHRRSLMELRKWPGRNKRKLFAVLLVVKGARD